MKKVIGILSFFFGFGLIVAIVLGFVLPLNIEITSSGITTYKLCRGFSYFLKYLPAIALTGFMVGFSVHFGRNSEGSTDRFSKAMFDRYKQVMILSIIFSFILTMAAEVCVPLINRTQASIINRPKLINDYIKVGNNLSITEDGTLSANAQKIDVDDTLDSNSVNPVQNKIVKNALDGKSDTTHNHDETYLKEVPKATKNTLGVIKVGTGLSVANDGTLSADAQAVNVTSSITQNSAEAVSSGAVFSRIGNLKFVVKTTPPISADDNTFTIVVPN